MGSAAGGVSSPTPGRITRSGFLRTLGPGLVWAAAAIGVSHLVQSTRAGATHGFALAGVIILANLLKYPFFEFGPRYAAATGESLIEGYRRVGRWAVIAYVVLTVGTMFAVEAAVTFVAGSIATQLFGPMLGPFGYAVAILAVCALMLIPGRYPMLDAAVKTIMVLLTVSTIVAVVGAALAAAAPGDIAARPPAELPTPVTFAFLIALVGWMPSAIDISVWQSLWTLERARQTGYRPRLSESLLDFNIGYIGTAILALCFLALGALVLHGSGEEIAASGGAFAAQLIRLYTQALGEWSRPVIVLAAFTTMFSTTLTVTDAFPRVLTRSAQILAPRALPGRGDGTYWGSMLLLIGGSVLLMGTLRQSLTAMVDIATTLSFLTAPVLSWLNLRVILGSNVPPAARPRGWLLWLSRTGLVFAFAFALFYLTWRLTNI